jgi:uncharacterized protein with PIN domain
MLGKLAKWLRTLGFDARSVPLRDRAKVLSLVSEGLIPVTRRDKLRDIGGVVFIHAGHQLDQVKELIFTLGIGIDEMQPFSRCSLCNAQLIEIPREAASGAVPDYIFETASDFRKCPECARVYWPGSHREKMIDRLKIATGLDLRQGLENGGR